MVVLALAMGALVAGGALDSAPARALTRPERCVPRPGPVPARRALPLTWKAGSVTQGCFFFSGPFDYGRDTHLGGQATMSVQGQSATLDFGRGVVFRGTLRGDQVSLTRRGTYEYGGQWGTTETISGTYSGNFLRARYDYQECDTGNRASCPGTCRIHATLTACAQ